MTDQPADAMERETDKLFVTDAELIRLKARQREHQAPRSSTACTPTPCAYSAGDLTVIRSTDCLVVPCGVSGCRGGRMAGIV